jgi:hypothetical protein
MRPGQIGRGDVRWIALAGAMLLTAACQSTASLDGGSASSAIKKTSAQPATPILSGDPASFIGLGGAELSRTLGQPKQVRKDSPAEIWQYSGADCVVDFYLYAGDAGLAVAYMEARDQTAESTPTDRCVKSLLQSVSADTQQKTL